MSLPRMAKTRLGNMCNHYPVPIRLYREFHGGMSGQQKYGDQWSRKMSYDSLKITVWSWPTISKAAIICWSTIRSVQFSLCCFHLWENYDRQVVLVENEQYIREILVKLKKLKEVSCMPKICQRVTADTCCFHVCYWQAQWSADIPGYEMRRRL